MATHTPMFSWGIFLFIGMGVQFRGPLKVGFLKIFCGHHAPGVHQVIQRACSKTGKTVLPHENGRGCRETQYLFSGILQLFPIIHRNLSSPANPKVLDVFGGKG